MSDNSKAGGLDEPAGSEEEPERWPPARCGGCTAWCFPALRCTSCGDATCAPCIQEGRLALPHVCATARTS